MTLSLALLVFLGGVLTILSPCILPVLPFVFARAEQPFLRNGLPLLLGMALNTRLPASNANASEAQAPAAYASSNTVVRGVGPAMAAPVSTRPRIGPAQGAHSNPVATPSRAEREIPPEAAPAPGAGRDSRSPAATNGRASVSANRGQSRVSASAPSTTSAKNRPY